jgi:RHS repeat-associated protein
VTNGTTTTHIWDGANIAAELTGSTVSATYVRGINLIAKGGGSQYYSFNAHGDVAQLTNSSGTVTKDYRYDAFGVEVDPESTDTNPWRYCGEYFDRETGTVYLRARYYDPVVGRFLAEDTHWNPRNMVYGDSPARNNNYRDSLGLNTYTYIPDVYAIRQSSNLYVYCGNNPFMFVDPTGEAWYHWVAIAGIVVVSGAAVVFTAGGSIAAGAAAVGAVASGMAAATTASTVAAGAFIGSSMVAGGALLMADYSSGQSFANSAGWGTVAFTAVGGIAGISYSYSLSRSSSMPTPVYKSHTQGNFRYNLQQLTGNSGTGMEAHHVLPQKFISKFSRAGIDIHNPIYGSWVGSSHQTWSYSYNQAWDAFFKAVSTPTAKQILQKATELSKQYGFLINFK